MIIRSSNYINEDMRLQPGDKFLVSIKNHVSEIDNSEKLNGYWLTVEEVDEHSQNIKTMENEKLSAYKHYAKEDEEIERETGHFTSCWFCWFDMEAVDVKEVPVGFQTYSFKQKNSTLPEL